VVYSLLPFPHTKEEAKRETAGASYFFHIWWDWTDWTGSRKVIIIMNGNAALLPARPVQVPRYRSRDDAEDQSNS
jgi:hypothetical protein